MKESSEEKSDNIDLLLKSTWLTVSKMFSDKAQEYDSTAVQALTLLKIDPKNGTRSTNLGPKMAIEPTSLTRIIKILETNGYIFKDKTASDKREVIIKLTDKGQKSREMSKKVVKDFNQRVLDEVSVRDIETFKKVMLKITSIANEINHKK